MRMYWVAPCDSLLSHGLEGLDSMLLLHAGLLLTGIVASVAWWLCGVLFVRKYGHESVGRSCMADSAVLLVVVAAASTWVFWFWPQYGQHWFDLRDWFVVLGINIGLVVVVSAVILWYAAKWGQLVLLWPLLRFSRKASSVRNYLHTRLTVPLSASVRGAKCLRWHQWAAAILVAVLWGALFGEYSWRISELVAEKREWNGWEPWVASAAIVGAPLLLFLGIGVLFRMVWRGRERGSQDTDRRGEPG
jgi:hypothetical protein